MEKCIGLFGTCGSSKWREQFIQKYDLFKIPYFNPVVPDWKPECAKVEAHHLANDAIILFPITGETYATGSLSEVGFSILQAVRLDDRRYFVVMIDPKLDDKLMTENPQLAKESLRSRALVFEHLKKLNLANIFVVDNLNDLLEVSYRLYSAVASTWDLQKYNPQNLK